MDTSHNLDYVMSEFSAWKITSQNLLSKEKSLQEGL